MVMGQSATGQKIGQILTKRAYRDPGVDAIYEPSTDHT